MDQVTCRTTEDDHIASAAEGRGLPGEAKEAKRKKNMKGEGELVFLGLFLVFGDFLFFVGLLAFFSLGLLIVSPLKRLSKIKCLNLDPEVAGHEA